MKLKSKLKKMLITIFMIALLFAFANVINHEAVGAEDDDYKLNFCLQTETISPETMIPVKQLTEAGMEYYELDGERVLLVRDDEFLYIDVEREIFNLSGQKIKSEKAPNLINDDLLIPYAILKDFWDDLTKANDELILKAESKEPAVSVEFLLIPEQKQIAADREEFEVEIILKNNSNLTQEYTFNTSQKYDLSLTDEDGNEVYRWSRDKSFLQAIQHLRLGVRETESWQTAIKIEDLSPGKYKLEGWLTDRRRSHSYSLTLEIEDE